ncbi:MAG: cupin domain-containing protein [Acidobacteria bacterium]|nr:cupin domain-containing protein [Acidobacteriota bacterium]
MSEGEARPKAVFSTNVKLPPGVHGFEAEGSAGKPAEAPDPIHRVIYMDDRVVPGSFYVEAVWVTGSVPTVHPVHRHDHDEILGFVGSDMADPSELGAEIDLIVDGVKTTITKTCFVHVPAGVEHGGLCFRKIDRPVFQIAMLRQDKFESEPPT